TISFVVLCIVAAISGKFTPLLIIAAPALFLIQACTALGIGMVFAILDAQYRDVRYVVPVLLNIGMFLTVLIRLDQWGEPLRSILSWNPMAAVVETYRALLFGQAFNVLLLAKGTAVAAALLLAGYWF